MTELKQLVEKRKELKAVEKETENYVLLDDFSMQHRYYKAHKLRKKTEKAIFKILENDINR